MPDDAGFAGVETPLRRLRAAVAQRPVGRMRRILGDEIGARRWIANGFDGPGRD